MNNCFGWNSQPFTITWPQFPKIIVYQHSDSVGIIFFRFFLRHLHPPLIFESVGKIDRWCTSDLKLGQFNVTDSSEPCSIVFGEKFDDSLSWHFLFSRWLFSRFNTWKQQEPLQFLLFNFWKKWARSSAPAKIAYLTHFTFSWRKRLFWVLRTKDTVPRRSHHILMAIPLLGTVWVAHFMSSPLCLFRWLLESQ